MKRPIESDYISLTAYTRALEAYCDTLAQPEPAIIGTYLEKDKEQEPVAWQVMVEDCAMKEFSTKDAADEWCVREKLSGSSYAYWIRPLYTTPPQRKPLTHEQCEEIAKGWRGRNWTVGDIIDAIEAAHGIKE